MAFLATLALVNALELSVDDLDPMLNSQYAIVQRSKTNEVKAPAQAGEEKKAIFVDDQKSAFATDLSKKSPTVIMEPAQSSSSAKSPKAYLKEGPGNSFRMVFPDESGKNMFRLAVPNSTVLMPSSLKSIKGLDKKISIKATNATATKITELLTKHGVNFVIRDKDVSAEKLTISLNNVPLHEALEVIGDSLGGYWEAKGTTLVFRKGHLFDFAKSADGFGKFNDMQLPDGLAFSFPPAEFSENSAKMREEFSRVREQGAKMREQASKMREEASKMREEASKARAEAAAKRKEQIEKFRSSLTPEQKNLMKKRGYLIGKDDLTKEQRELLNIQEMINSGCDYEVNINNEIVVRNK